MLNKKRNLILIAVLIIIIQILLYFNNNQKTTFRYFIWNIQEVKIGKLISISFVSGLLVSTILNKLLSSSKFDKFNDDHFESNEGDDFDNLIDDDEDNSQFEMPPQRDIRETQPTISVNYRVIKNNGNDNSEYRQDFSKETNYQDDWNNKDNEW